MSTKNKTIEERKAYLDQLMREHDGSKTEIGDSVNYYTDFENYLRTAKVEDSLKAGSDKEGGYLVPDEYHDKLIQKLEDEHVTRKLATVFTADHNISIPGVSKHGEADWISEGVPYPGSDEEFNGIELGARKNGCITIVSDELLEILHFLLRIISWRLRVANLLDLRKKRFYMVMETISLMSQINVLR